MHSNYIKRKLPLNTKSSSSIFKIQILNTKLKILSGNDFSILSKARKLIINIILC